MIEKIHGNPQAYNELVETGKELESQGRFFEASRDYEVAMEYAKKISKECMRECTQLLYNALVKDAKAQDKESGFYSVHLLVKAASYAKESGLDDLAKQAAREAYDLLMDPNSKSFMRNARLDATNAAIIATDYGLGKKLVEDAHSKSGLDENERARQIGLKLLPQARA